MSPSITASQLKELRNWKEKSFRQAAEIVGITPRQWKKYESEDANIPEKIIELFCLKLKIPYPPIDTEGNLIKAIKIVLTNYKNGVGKTLITFNVGCLIQKEGSRVLLVDASNNNNLLKIYERVKAFSTLCPKVISIDKYKVDDKKIDKDFDYIIFDSDMTCVTSYLKNCSLNLIVTPTRLSYWDVESTKKTHLEISKYIPQKKVFAMVIGYNPCCITNYVNYVEVKNIKNATTNNEVHEDIIGIQDQCYSSMISNKIKIFDSYTTQVIDYYVRKSETLDDFFLLVQNQPCSWVTKEMQNITNEIKAKSVNY